LPEVYHRAIGLANDPALESVSWNRREDFTEPRIDAISKRKR